MRPLLLSEIFPPMSGGSGRWFWELYRRLDPSKTCVLAGAQPNQSAFDQTHSLNLRRISLDFPTWSVLGREGLMRYARVKREVERAYAEHNADQLHCGRPLPEGLIGWWLKRRRGYPYACYVHGEELNYCRTSRELSWWLRRVLGKADLVIANSQNTQNILKQEWSVPEKSLCLLHPGVDAQQFRPISRDVDVKRRLGWANCRVILTVGRLQRRKGHDKMIEALPEILQSFPDALYVVVGDGEEREYLKHCAEQARVTDRVQFRSASTDEELLECYQHCDAFILPNRSEGNDIEGFGMVLVEAQACGKPVIAGASGGTRETMVVGETGYIVDCTDPHLIASAVVELLSKPGDDLATIGQRGRKWVVDHLDWTVHVERARACFERLSASQV